MSAEKKRKSTSESELHKEVERLQNELKTLQKEKEFMEFKQKMGSLYVLRFIVNGAMCGIASALQETGLEEKAVYSMMHDAVPKVTEDDDDEDSVPNVTEDGDEDAST